MMTLAILIMSCRMDWTRTKQDSFACSIPSPGWHHITIRYDADGGMVWWNRENGMNGNDTWVDTLCDSFPSDQYFDHMQSNRLLLRTRWRTLFHRADMSIIHSKKEEGHCFDGIKWIVINHHRKTLLFGSRLRIPSIEEHDSSTVISIMIEIKDHHYWYKGVNLLFCESDKSECDGKFSRSIISILVSAQWSQPIWFSHHR
jgi:hypothetical protein